MIKKCSQCNHIKDIEDFYSYQGKPRSECKKCSIRRSVIYQRRTKSWKDRYVDQESRRAYMRAYYEKNKQKFAAYRASFRQRHPSYYKDYCRRKKTTAE